MIKNILFYANLILIVASAHSGGSKKSISLFSQIQKREINGRPKRIIIQDKDFSNQNFRNQNFRNCTFINVKFRNADLTQTRLEGVKFENVDLEGAILYYPLDDSDKPIMEKSVRLQFFDIYYLVRYYSIMMTIGQDRKNEGLIKEADIYFAAAKCLNKIFAPLSISFRSMHFCGCVTGNTPLNLTGIDLENFNFEGSLLYNVILEGANLRGTNFEKSLLINVSFTGADLRESNLKSVKFMFSNLQNTDLRNSKINDAKFLEDSNILKDESLNDLLKTFFEEKREYFNISILPKKFDISNISGAILSNQLVLYETCKDEDLLEIYYSCTNFEAKIILEQILKAKRILLNNNS